MKGRQIIRTDKKWGFDELMRFLRDRWDEDFSRKPEEFTSRPVIGRYMILPGTLKFCVMIYPCSKGVALITYPADGDIMIKFANDVRYPADASGTRTFFSSSSTEKERTGPAEDILLEYTEYVRKLLESASGTRYA